MELLSNLHISTYTKRLISQHIGYFVAVIFYAVLILVFIPMQFSDYSQARDEAVELNQRVEDLSKRRAVINSYPEDDLEELVLLLNTLYPSEEDKFSIFSALDTLQVVTGIQILTYSSPFAGKSLNEVIVVVRAQADEKSFRTFLASHVFRSGRFMTIDKIVYDAKGDILDFTAKFHSHPVNISDQVAQSYSSEGLKQLRIIQQDMSGSGYIRKQSTQEVEPLLDYSTKDNPFE